LRGGTAVRGGSPYWRDQSPPLSLTRDTDLAQRTAALFRGAREGEALAFRCPDRRAGAADITLALLYPHCCGVDVHKFSLTACVRRQEKSGQARKIVRRRGVMTADLRALAQWWTEQPVTHVAMESTGVYRKPVWNILEGPFTLLWAQAQHVKNVPGRKTDSKASEWLAERLPYGLRHSRFVPPPMIRDWRDWPVGAPA
jgi:hypothetical protein